MKGEEGEGGLELIVNVVWEVKSYRKYLKQQKYRQNRPERKQRVEIKKNEKARIQN